MHATGPARLNKSSRHSRRVCELFDISNTLKYSNIYYCSISTNIEELIALSRSSQYFGAMLLIIMIEAKCSNFFDRE